MKTSQHWTGHVFIATSVDGYIALPDGDLDWLTDPPLETGHAPAFRSDDPPPDYEEFTAAVTHLVMGRGTYEKVTTFDSWPYERFRTVVLSTTLSTDIDDRVTVAPTLEDVVALLDAERARKVYLDGGKVITAFLAADLIEELTISRAPVILGDGLPLFHALPHPVRLAHLGTSTSNTGMTSTRYSVSTTSDNQKVHTDGVS